MDEGALQESVGKLPGVFSINSQYYFILSRRGTTTDDFEEYEKYRLIGKKLQSRLFMNL